jgi:hypothetical protein
MTVIMNIAKAKTKRRINETTYMVIVITMVSNIGFSLLGYRMGSVIYHVFLAKKRNHF